MTTALCDDCGHSIEAHSGRPDRQNDACTVCSCPRFVRLVVVNGGRATIGTPKLKDNDA